MRDELDDILGIDTDDPTQQLALALVEADHVLLEGLAAHRRKNGLSQAEIGERMGVTQPAVAAFERADSDPKLSTIRRYALALGVLVQHTMTRHISISVSAYESESATTTADITVRKASSNMSLAT